MRELVCDVAVIGAGTAGLHAYRAARDAGANVVLIERGTGGSTCTRVGCMPSKALIAAGRAAAQARRAGLFGIGLTAPVIDGRAVMRRVRAERDHFTQAILDEYHAIPQDHRPKGAARFVAATTLQVGEDLRVAAKQIVIATGSRPHVPAALDRLGACLHTNETIFELEDLPRRLAVVGAGPLGLELAQAFARLGTAVTVLDQGKKVGNLADPHAERAAHDALAQDLAIHLGVEVAAERNGDEAILRWSGASTGEVRVDAVLAASGRSPNLEDLDLHAAGIVVGDDGTPSFAEVTRRIDHLPITIAGDAGGWRPVLHEASRGGRIAGRAAAADGRGQSVPALAIAFTEPNLVEVGTRFDDLPDDARIGDARVADNGRARIDGEDAGLVRLYADDAGVLIGGTIVATGGEHLGQALAMAVQCGMRAAELAELPWYHPTLEELLQQAARDIG